VRRDPCPSFITVAPGRHVYCAQYAGHGPADDIHQGLLHVTLPDGREHAASLVWSTAASAIDRDHLQRSS
jgi:hypothetical protein